MKYDCFRLLNIYTRGKKFLAVIGCQLAIVPVFNLLSQVVSISVTTAAHLRMTMPVLTFAVTVVMTSVHLVSCHEVSTWWM